MLIWEAVIVALVPACAAISPASHSATYWETLSWTAGSPRREWRSAAGSITPIVTVTVRRRRVASVARLRVEPGGSLRHSPSGVRGRSRA